MQGALLSETKRLLETGLAFAQTSVLNVKLPLDTVLRGVLIRMSGVITTTFSSAAAASETSIIDNIVSRIEVVAGGSRTVKNVKPHMVQMLALYSNGYTPERRSSGAAAAALLNNPLADAGFTYGSTTQITTMLETLYLPFEMIACKEGRQATWLDTRGLPSCDLRLITGSYTGFDKSGNVTFSAANISFEISTVEAMGYTTAEKYDWKQTVLTDTIASRVTERRNDLPRGNKVCGVGIFVIQDQSGADSTATVRKRPVNNAIDTIKFRLNGREIYSNTYRSLFSDNQSRHGMNALFASSQSRRDGYVYVDFLTDGLLGSALDAREAKSFEVLTSTQAADASLCVYPLDISYETGELVAVS